MACHATPSPVRRTAAPIKALAITRGREEGSSGTGRTLCEPPVLADCSCGIFWQIFNVGRYWSVSYSKLFPSLYEIRFYSAVSKTRIADGWDCSLIWKERENRVSCRKKNPRRETFPPTPSQYASNTQKSTSQQPKKKKNTHIVYIGETRFSIMSPPPSPPLSSLTFRMD